jgi:hypothetical protein
MSFEQRVRSTLKDAGSRIDTTAEPTAGASTAASPSQRRRFRPVLVFLTGFAAVLLFGVAAVLVSGGRGDPAGDDQPTFPGLLGSIVDLLPDGFDPAQAAPLLTIEGNPEDVATQYLEGRVPTIGAGVSRVEEQDGYTLVQWAWGRLLNPDDPGRDGGEEGWLILRPILRGFEVVAATTDGVDLSDVTVSDGAVRGVVESSTDQFIGADVLSLDGSPVDSAPYPDGYFSDAMSLWGTAGASRPPLELEVPVSEPVIVRVNGVGGTLLSISEVILGSDTTTPQDVAQGVQQMPGPPLSDQEFEEVFGNEDSVDVIRESAFFVHARDQDAPNLGEFGLYGATTNSADGVEYDRPVNCIFQYGMDGEVSGHQCGPTISLDKPGIALTSSCADPGVTLFSAWAINPEADLVELIFSDGSNQQLEPTRGYVIWAWENTKQLTHIRVEGASPEVQQAVGDYVDTLPFAPCD